MFVCLCFGGADGIRTHDLLDAIEARSQLRHGPTELPKVYHRSIPSGGHPDAFSLSNLLPALQVLSNEFKLRAVTANQK